MPATITSVAIASSSSSSSSFICVEVQRHVSPLAARLHPQGVATHAVRCAHAFSNRSFVWVWLKLFCSSGSGLIGLGRQAAGRRLKGHVLSASQRDSTELPPSRRPSRYPGEELSSPLKSVIACMSHVSVRAVRLSRRAMRPRPCAGRITSPRPSVTQCQSSEGYWAPCGLVVPAAFGPARPRAMRKAGPMITTIMVRPRFCC